MGYKEGSGLGANCQGLVQAIQLKSQSGCQGLGHTAQDQWDFEQEVSIFRSA